MTKPTLGGVFRELQKVNWRRGRCGGPSSTNSSLANLAQELRVPIEVIGRVLDEVNAELQNLGDKDDSGDPRSIIDRANAELAKHRAPMRTDEERILLRRVQELPARDYQILYLAKQGKKHRQIAALMKMDLHSVRVSLASVYARLLHPDDRFGDGEPHPTEQANEQCPGRAA